MASKKRRKSRNDLFDYYQVDENAWPCEPEIDKIVNDAINPRGLDVAPGVAVAVRVNKQVVHVKGYGCANLESGEKITPDTVFDLGSLSKQFTALAILSLVINEKVSLTILSRNSLRGFHATPTLSRSKTCYTTPQRCRITPTSM